MIAFSSITVIVGKVLAVLHCFRLLIFKSIRQEVKRSARLEVFNTAFHLQQSN